MVLDIRRRLGEDVADMWDDTDIYRSIDQGVMQFNHEERWPWLYTVRTGDQLTVGTHTLTLPTDIDPLRSFAVTLTTGGEPGYQPRKVNPAEGLRLRTRSDVNGRPRYFYVAQVAQSATGPGDETMTATLRFVPAADKTYDIEYLYYRRPAALSSGDQEPDLPEDYHPAIVAWACAQLWMHELVGQEIKAREQLEIYLKIVDQAKRDMFRLGEDESLVWGREEDEEERMGYTGLPQLPGGYGPSSGWGI